MKTNQTTEVKTVDEVVLEEDEIAQMVIRFLGFDPNRSEVRFDVGEGYIRSCRISQTHIDRKESKPE